MFVQHQINKLDRKSRGSIINREPILNLKSSPPKIVNKIIYRNLELLNHPANPINKTRSRCKSCGRSRHIGGVG